MIYKHRLRAIAETEGLNVEELVETGGRHVKLYVKNSQGEKKVVFFSRTPSDYRAIRNFRAELRRFAQNITADTYQKYRG